MPSLNILTPEILRESEKRLPGMGFITAKRAIAAT